MPNQIIKQNIPNEVFFKLLDTNCVKNDKYYTFDTNSFKKGIYNGTIVEFTEFCKPFYHVSKNKYLDRKLTYKNFVTVLRQICKCNNITYTSKVKYDKSSYETLYYIFTPSVV